jgi:hypothetical protein
MTHSNAFLRLLSNDFPAGVQSDSYLRATLILGQKLAEELGGSGDSNPARNVADFLAVHLSDDPYIVGLIRQRLNTAIERYAR